MICQLRKLRYGVWHALDSQMKSPTFQILPPLCHCVHQRRKNLTQLTERLQVAQLCADHCRITNALLLRYPLFKYPEHTCHIQTRSLDCKSRSFKHACLRGWPNDIIEAWVLPHSSWERCLNTTLLECPLQKGSDGRVEKWCKDLKRTEKMETRPCSWHI